MTEPRIRVAISDPKLKEKIHVDLSGPLDTVYWYIRFNIPLDEETVNENTMEVTDTDGYIMRTDISYRSDDYRIVISPLDSYEEQRFYLLKISKAVRSLKGQNLKTVISILFKLYQGAISEYKVLRKDVPVPPSRPRPANYDAMQENRKPNFLDDYVENRKTHTEMKTENVSMKLWVGIMGLLIVGFGLAIQDTLVAAFGIAICATGVLHIYLQWSNKEFRSGFHYNRGVRLYNKMQYERASEAFEKALVFNPKNELARYGLVRVGMYNKS